MVVILPQGASAKLSFPRKRESRRATTTPVGASLVGALVSPTSMDRYYQVSSTPSA